ncbi:EI24 domain-containing protein [Ktedonosporobacter rubrisoli]|uniref:EI24 domain-containing protein n=1 Tax=Ktedonosporobacter rubrisoli TaxID=2509675 RepID=A0A4P6JSF7_KTERU|nr:EI24 domain-containing protein [Ktedonosporobacter rubrisoli]QBD78459.1 EI24 domain-containing protein [Ktedonosporobacter rubrisoli]
MLSQAIPAQVEQKVAEYHLGTPQKVHQRDHITQDIRWSLLCIIIGLLCLVYVILHQPGVDLVAWLIALCPLVIGALLMARSINARTFLAFECSAGFLEWSKRQRRVLYARRWDELREAYERNYRRSRTTYHVLDSEGKEHDMPYHQLWERCVEELKQ